MKSYSFAKINLWLRVLGPRPDGYHDIETVFHQVSLRDELHVEVIGRLARCEVRMSHPPGSTTPLPAARDNLAWRAWRELVTLVPKTERRGARIAIKKNIPVGAGLAGGSGNAAAVLRALDRSWRLNLGQEELRRHALEIGSDVPFMLHGGTMLGRGRGEQLEALPAAPDLRFVLGISGEGLSTADVYRSWSPEHTEGAGPDEIRDALTAGDAGDIATVVRNDLEAPALRSRPELADKIASIEQAGALRGFLSGSGPTVVGLARDEDHARAVASKVEPLFDRVEVVRSQPAHRL